MSRKPEWMKQWERQQQEFAERLERRLVTKGRVDIIELVKIIRHYTDVDLKTAVQLARYLRDSGIVKKLKVGHFTPDTSNQRGDRR